MKKEKKKQERLNGDELEKKLEVMLIIEILGRPKEHLIEALEDIIKKIGEEKGVNVVDSKINEPSLVKDQKDLLTTFAEIEIEVDNLSILSILMFKYMPSHIEIIFPEKITISNNILGDMMSELTRRLHGYDELARVMQAREKILQNEIAKLKGETKK